MSKDKQNILVGVANEGQLMFSVETIEKWEPKKVSILGSSIFFEQEGTFFSMDRMKFKEIFGNEFYKFK